MTVAAWRAQYHLVRWSRNMVGRRKGCERKPKRAGARAICVTVHAFTISTQLRTPSPRSWPLGTAVHVMGPDQRASISLGPGRRHFRVETRRWRKAPPHHCLPLDFVASTLLVLRVLGYFLSCIH